MKCSDCTTKNMPDNVARYGKRCIRCWVRWQQFLGKIPKNMYEGQ